ncbi:MAG: response regulator [Pseudobacter sp.]|uniref:response regulator n=1 Tax=Pseudobacter sp. TaxID=2045420 RepID=UPI003F7E414B
MIQKVLIAEDHESSNISIQKTLEELEIGHIDYVYYCDDAFSKVGNALNTGNSYDLLITDLYFEEDQVPQKIDGGKALIAAVRKVQPDLRVLVFSAESNPYMIENLFQKYEIDGFVRKARNDAKELKKAIETIAANQRYFPRHLMQLINQKNVHDFSDFDITIISLLANGLMQKDIPAYLKENKIKPSGLSSVEKRLNLMKQKFDFSNNQQLVLYCQSLALI